MRLVLIRHGQTPSNVLGLLDTAPPGPGLTELGITQAALVPDVVAGEPIQAIYASTATRARQTAEPLADRLGLSVNIRGDIREIAAGDWEMLDDEHAVRGYLTLIGEWMAGRFDARSPGSAGESGHDVLQRFDRVVHEVASSGVDGAALVAHGAINRLWASVRAVNLPDDFGAEHALRNTGVVVLEGDLVEGWTVVSWSGAELDREAAPDAASAPDDDPFDETIPVPGSP
ncbi:probable phosphoglycerate mutase [Nakamurella panacisegetis]|uniref:Probable phosphoglycerate mutase n=1 Tax=Nakamurella panacisegetis TaxID=1090615 RepID=A0A1H0K6V0_9ACTN|nr:histidine phosphatase family protein [Nakamurella panacisegetis]SDO51778.1 probable phosphoglycerate mutase [Nakamurella panacisegetis]